VAVLASDPDGFGSNDTEAAGVIPLGGVAGRACTTGMLDGIDGMRGPSVGATTGSLSGEVGVPTGPSGFDSEASVGAEAIAAGGVVGRAIRLLDGVDGMRGADCERSGVGFKTGLRGDDSEG
jgi:hypothetical protein